MGISLYTAKRKILTKSFKICGGKIELMEYINFRPVEGGDNYTNHELRFNFKFLKQFFWIKRGLAAVRAAALCCGVYVCLGHPGDVFVIKSTHIYPILKYLFRYKKGKITKCVRKKMAKYLSFIIIFIIVEEEIFLKSL